MICFFFFNDTATTEIYTLSLHDALPIFACLAGIRRMIQIAPQIRILVAVEAIDGRKGIDAIAQLCREKLDADPFSGYLFILDRKSTRLNSSHTVISYAVFCLKKTKNETR